MLVFGDKVVHVAFSFSEFHLVHTLTSVPMQESLATEHSSKLVTDTLEELLDRGGVANKGGGHLEATWGNGAERGLDVVGNPLNEVALVLVLDVAHLVLNFLHGDLTTAVEKEVSFDAGITHREEPGNIQDGGASEITAVTEIGSGHHVLGVEHLLGQLGNAHSAERVSTAAGQRSEANHEEVETREGNHVDGQLAEVGVELTRETKTSADTGHDSGDQVVEVTVRWVGQLEGTHANIVQSLEKGQPIDTNIFCNLAHSYLIVDTEGLVGVLDQLVNRESSVVGLDNGVGDLGGRDNGECGHHTVGELLTDLGDEEGTHTGTGTTTKGVGDLETLEGVTALSLATNNIDNLVNQFGTLSVVTLGPVVTSTGLAEDEVVGAEKFTEGTSTDGIHGTGLEVDQDGTRNVLLTTGLIEIIRKALYME